MKKILFLVLLTPLASAYAQTNLSDTMIEEQLQTTDSMPEHSKENYIGAYLAEIPKYQGSTEMKPELVLDVKQMWSNGVFLSFDSWKPYDTYQLGMHLSSTQNVDYGLLTGLGLNRAAFITGSDGNANKDWMPFAGGFFKYRLAEDIQLNSQVLYYFGQFRGGAYADLNLVKSFAINDHQTVALSVGTNIGNNAFTDTQYGITPQQARQYGYPAYTPSSGVEDVHMGVNWHWDLSSAWMLNSSIYATHLTSNVSGTKQVQNENNGSLFVGLAYRF
jgi:outer membrane scaffolding protein for murein synthesis (MipA/OmpV family)